MKRFLVFVLGIMVPMLVHAGRNDKVFYVSPSGNDRYPGTLKKPFATIEMARDAVRKINTTMNQDITVYLRGGRYYLQEPVRLDVRDSGQNGYFVRYQAYPGEQPELCGGDLVIDWHPDETGLYMAGVKGEFRQLYVNGRRCTRARTPDEGSYYRLKFWNERDREIIIDRDLIHTWGHFDQVDMIVQMHWAEAVLPLASYTIHGDFAFVAPREPERDLVFRRMYPIKSEHEAFHFENAFEFLDQSGEWYHDPVKGTLYYKPRPEEKTKSLQAIVPRLQRLLHIDGTLDQPVHHVTFSGIQFSHSGWILPQETGMLQSQAGHYTVRVEADNRQFFQRPPAAVYVTGGHHITFERNVFTHLGATALDLHYGTHDNLIIGNVFYDISGTGIMHSKFSEEHEVHTTAYNPEDQREICRNDTISNNLITRIGRDYPGCCGIACGFPHSVVIEHNEIYDLPYSGISVGWSWMDADNAMADNQVRHNHIHHVLQLLCDGGGVYTLARQPNSIIGKNYIHDIGRSPWAVGSKNNGIFLDQGSSGLTVAHNVFENLAEEPIRHNMTGTIVQIQNGSRDRDVMENAGLQQAYRDIPERIR